MKFSARQNLPWIILIASFLVIIWMNRQTAKLSFMQEKVVYPMQVTPSEVDYLIYLQKRNEEKGKPLVYSVSQMRSYGLQLTPWGGF